MRKMGLGIISFIKKIFDYMQTHHIYLACIETLRNRLQNIEVVVMYAVFIKIDKVISDAQHIALKCVGGVLMIGGTLKTKVYLEHCKTRLVGSMCG